MKIIPHHRKVSAPVISFGQIKFDVERMTELVNKKDHTGKWKEALALHHSQVSEGPLNFFVVNRGVAGEFDGHEVFINPRIVDQEDPVPFKEACLTFPFRDEIKTKRWYKIMVDFETPKPSILRHVGSGVRTIRMGLEGLPAFIFQHEFDHGQGMCIFDRFKK